MSGEEFKKLNDIDKINYVNSELKKGKTATDITLDLGLGKNYISTIMKKNRYERNKESNQYIPIVEATTETTTQSTTENTTNYITIDLIDDKHLKPKPKSIRINEFVYQEWQEFCDKQHYSKMDLISMALKEYMEKYN